MTTANVDPALERNRAFAAAGGHQGAVVFPNLRLFVITCLDPRVDPAHFLGLGLSDAMVVRNVGGRVTPEVINDVAFIGQLAENRLPDGPLFKCATAALADDAFRRRDAERTTRSLTDDECTQYPHINRCPSLCNGSTFEPPPRMSACWSVDQQLHRSRPRHEDAQRTRSSGPGGFGRGSEAHAHSSIRPWR
jgi:hypothetical protein